MLNYFLEDLAKKEPNRDWFHIQKFALQNNEAGNIEIMETVLKAQRLSVNIPVIRKVASRVEVKVDRKTHTYEKGDIIILDIVSIEVYVGTKPLQFYVSNALYFSSTLHHKTIRTLKSQRTISATDVVSAKALCISTPVKSPFWD